MSCGLRYNQMADCRA